MIERACLRLIDEDELSYICNEKWFKTANKEAGRYEVISDNIVSSEIDLIKYCLEYHYKIDIPNKYNIVEIYSIVFTTSDFEPDDRNYSSCRANIIYSDEDYNKVKTKFIQMCKSVKKKSSREGKDYLCWHTEDYAHNQIIHSYVIDKSYIVKEVEVD